MTRGAVLALMILMADASDWRLVVPGENWPTCAKDEASCTDIQRAIRQGFIQSIMPDAKTRCEPAPDCFSERSNCIPGYVGPRREGHCR